MCKLRCEVFVFSLNHTACKTKQDFRSDLNSKLYVLVNIPLSVFQKEDCFSDKRTRLHRHSWGHTDMSSGSLFIHIYLHFPNVASYLYLSSLAGKKKSHFAFCAKLQSRLISLHFCLLRKTLCNWNLIVINSLLPTVGDCWQWINFNLQPILKGHLNSGN